MLTCQGLEALQGVKGPDFDGVVVRAREELVVCNRQRQYRPRMVLQHLHMQSALDICSVMLKLNNCFGGIAPNKGRPEVWQLHTTPAF